MHQPQQPAGYNSYQPGPAYYYQQQPQPQFSPAHYEQQAQPGQNSYSAQAHHGTNYPAQQQPSAEKKEEKKGFFAKVKGFFGK